MSKFFDTLEHQSADQRERMLVGSLPAAVAHALTAPGWARHLGAIDPRSIHSREALAKLPVLRKSDLPRLQKEHPPFGGFNVTPPGHAKRLMMSPGPIFEPEGHAEDFGQAARALYAAGFRRGDVVHNTLSYHFTPGAFLMESAAHAVGCAVIAAGGGNTEGQLDAIEHFKPVAYMGTPDYLKILLDAAVKAGRDASSFKRAAVGGAALPASLRKELNERGVAVLSSYALAEVGVVAYETPALEGMVVNENIIVEIVKPGTGDPVPEGDVGEVVVTSFNPDYPMIRLATGDMSAVMAGLSPCGRTNTRIKGWMGRADQTAKVKGMFVRPDQVAEIAKRFPQLGRLRLAVTRNGEQDAMTLHAESAADDGLTAKLAETLQAVTKLRGDVKLVAPGSLPNDGKIIADERPVG